MYGKMTYTETTALKEDFIIDSSQEEGHVTPRSHMGKHQGWSGGGRKEGNHGPEPWLRFSGREWTRQDRQAEQL